MLWQGSGSQLCLSSSKRLQVPELLRNPQQQQQLPRGCRVDLGLGQRPTWGSLCSAGAARPNGSQARAGRGEERARGRDAGLAALRAAGAVPLQRGHGGRAPRALPAAAGKFHKGAEQNYAPLTVSGRTRVWRTNVVGLRFKLPLPSLDRGKFTVASIFSWRGPIQVCECQETCSDLFLFKLRMLKHQPSNKRHIESKICNGARVTLRLVECVWWLFSAELGGGERKRTLIF